MTCTVSEMKRFFRKSDTFQINSEILISSEHSNEKIELV